MPKKKESSVLVDSVMKWDGKGSAVEKTKPQQAVYALELLSQGYSYAKVREMSGVGWEALWRLAEDHKPALEVRRAELAHRGFIRAQKVGALIDRRMEMIAEDDEDLKKISLKDLALSGAILQDKSFDALGEGTKVQIEHRTAKPSLADAMKAIQEAREALQKEAIPVEAKVVEEAK